ncbi:hypothetical protein [Bradyrhizobium sp. USDA 4513]
MYDKGKAKGAIIQNEIVVKDCDGDKIATILSSLFARGDGGFGGPSKGMPELHRMPRRTPDSSVDIPVQSDQALIYRLSGDRGMSRVLLNF